MKYAIMLAATFKIHLIIMALTAILSGCGSDSEDESAASTSPESDIFHTEETSNLKSISLKEKSDLPECLEANETQLAYIIDEETFYVCESLEWVEADIKAKDGEKGERGDPGIDGQDATLSNVWIDPVTGYEWIIGGFGTWGGSYCAVGYQGPDLWSGSDAVAHGLLTASASIGGPTSMWTSNDSGVQGYYLDTANTWQLAAKSSSKGIFCYKN